MAADPRGRDAGDESGLGCPAVHAYGPPEDPNSIIPTVRTPQGVMTIRDAAVDLLGLTEIQADKLAYDGNTLGEMWELAEQFSDGAIKSPYWLPRWAFEASGEE